MSRRKRAKVVHGPTHHYAPLAMSPVVSFDKQATHQFPAFQSPLPRPSSAASTSPASVPTRTSSYSNLLPLRSVTDSPLSSPSVSLSSAPLPSPLAGSEQRRQIDLQHDPYLLEDDQLPDVDSLVAHAQPKNSALLVQQMDEVPATPTPPNPPPPPHVATAPPVQRSLSYLLADSSPPPPPSRQQSHPESQSQSTASAGASLTTAPMHSAESADDYPSLSQLLDEEEEERRQLVEEEDFASLDELLNQSDDEDTPAFRSSSGPTQQLTPPTQPTQPTQVLSPTRSPSEDGDEQEANGVDEMAATQVLQQRTWAEDSQSQSQRLADDERRDGGPANVGGSVSCGVSEWQSSLSPRAEGDIRVLARPHLLHTGRILLSNSSSLSPTPG